MWHPSSSLGDQRGALHHPTCSGEEGCTLALQGDASTEFGRQRRRAKPYSRTTQRLGHAGPSSKQARTAELYMGFHRHLRRRRLACFRVLSKSTFFSGLYRTPPPLWQDMRRRPCPPHVASRLSSFLRAPSSPMLSRRLSSLAEPLPAEEHRARRTHKLVVAKQERPVADYSTTAQLTRLVARTGSGARRVPPRSSSLSDADGASESQWRRICQPRTKTFQPVSGFRVPPLKSNAWPTELGLFTR